MMGSKVILRRRLQPPLPDAACESWISSLNTQRPVHGLDGLMTGNSG